MPIVEIIYRNDAVDPEILQSLRCGLRKIVAQALSTSDAKLSEEDIELIFEQGSSLNIGKDLKVLVSANDFPERKANLQERAVQISKGIKELLPPLMPEDVSPTGFVYVLLSDGGLGEF